MSSDTQLYQVPVCSRHCELIQEYCETCKELLCIQCLRAGHSTKHKTSKFVDHLQNRKMEAEGLSQRIEHIKAQICNLQKLFQEKRNKFCSGLQKTEEKINQSFQEVHKAMHDWEIRHRNILERKNKIQLQRLDEAHKKGSKLVHIERPKVWIRTNARKNLHGIVRGLTPTLVLSISGATSYSRHHSHGSQFEQLEYDYARPIGNCSHKGSRGKSLSVTTPVRLYNPSSNINNDKSMLKKGQANWGLSEEPEELYYSELVTNDTLRQRDNACDDKVKYINVLGLQLSPPSSSPIVRPPLPAPPLQPPPPLRSYPEEISKSKEQVDEYDMLPDPPFPNPVTDSEYTSMYNINTPQSPSPPPLPPRPHPIMVGTNDNVQDDYDLLPEGHAYQIFDPKMILLKPASIILNGLAATNPSESVMLNDVCTGPLGSMIFTDQLNFCIRIIMTADEKQHKLTKEMRCQLQAVAYDQKSLRIIVASEKGLHHLEFDETKPNKAKNLKLFLKDNYCMSITITKPVIRGEETLIYAVTKKHEETFISCFKQNGQFVNKLDVTGKPCCIAYKDGYLVVATSQDRNLTKINTSGSPLWDIDVDARKKGVLFDPFRVVILPNHNIAVSERKQHCISVFSKEGQHILRFGQFGDEPGMFKQPTGIAVRLEKELVVVDSENKRIQIFALDELAKQFEVAVVEKERAENEESEDDDNTIEL